MKKKISAPAKKPAHKAAPAKAAHESEPAKAPKAKPAKEAKPGSQSIEISEAGAVTSQSLSGDGGLNGSE